MVRLAHISEESAKELELKNLSKEENDYYKMALVGVSNFDVYEKAAETTAIYPNDGLQGLNYTLLGLSGEVGEMCNKFKKVLRDADGKISPEVIYDLKKELGDVMWYVTRVAAELNTNLENICCDNTKKLMERKNKGTIKGSGDDR